MTDGGRTARQLGVASRPAAHLIRLGPPSASLYSISHPHVLCHHIGVSPIDCQRANVHRLHGNLDQPAVRTCPRTAWLGIGAILSGPISRTAAACYERAVKRLVQISNLLCRRHLPTEASYVVVPAPSRLGGVGVRLNQSRRVMQPEKDAARALPYS